MSDSEKDNSPIITGLFLGNLTLLPIIGFIILAIWFFKSDDKKTLLEQHYLLVSMYGTLASLFLLVIVPLLSILISGLHENMVMFMLVYFIFVHGMMILFATYSVARSLNQDFLFDRFNP